ncbi:Diphosphoinositol polyphosphate phosphohydrolase 1-like [Oopsacas minuta]|uniref:Diphosphoinositol polyphosphate phosphohydrolase 1-like n=1 Tax=Oopsacas minuta TaxID=111878 RepID=A0AAV7JKF0_9METZ|nr:Diphosphoinositol polyphosphate phosphohydrolase 1-like [Oopsacas minuta]
MKQRASAICFRDSTRQEVLLCTSNKDPERWGLPGGGIEEGEEAPDSAIRESLEETGFVGGEPEYIGEYFHISKDGFEVRTRVYTLIMIELRDDWREKYYKSHRKWFPFSELPQRIPKIPQKTFVSKFVNLRLKKLDE